MLMRVNYLECKDLRELSLNPGDLFLVTKWAHSKDQPFEVLLAEIQYYVPNLGEGFHARDIRCLHSSDNYGLPPLVNKSMHASEYFFEEVNQGHDGYRIFCSGKECYTQDRILEALGTIPGMRCHMPNLREILERKLESIKINA